MKDFKNFIIEAQFTPRAIKYIQDMSSSEYLKYRKSAPKEQHAELDNARRGIQTSQQRNPSRTVVAATTTAQKPLSSLPELTRKNKNQNPPQRQAFATKQKPQGVVSGKPKAAPQSTPLNIQPKAAPQSTPLNIQPKAAPQSTPQTSAKSAVQSSTASSQPSPQTPKRTQLSQRVSNVLSSKPVRYGTRALNVVGTLASGVSEYQRRRAEGESDAEAKRNAAIVTGLETAGGYGAASLAGGLTSASGPGAVVAGLGGYAAGSSAAGSIARSLLPTPKERKERINQPVVSARRELSKTKTPGTVAGSGIVGAGGQSIVSRTPKGATFISTGTGKQRRTAQLPSQMLLPSGRVGDLAFKNNKPTYLARPSLEQQRQDPVSRFQRWANPAFRQAERDVEARQRRQAAASTRRYYGQLGINPQRQQQLNPAVKPVKPKVRVSGKLK